MTSHTSSFPRVGARVQRGRGGCTVDSLKSSSEIYAPSPGIVVDVNSVLASEENCTAGQS